MAWFEVFIPSLDGGAPGITLTLEAPNWIGALRTGLQNIGEGQSSIANVMCDIKEDNSIHVTDVASHRVFRLREVQKPEVATAPPAPAPPAPAPEPARSTATKTLLEFQRPDFSKLTPSGDPTDEDDGDPDTIQTAPLEAPTALASSLAPPPAASGQSTIEMSIPWATMPPPSSSSPLPGVTLPAPSATLAPPVATAPSLSPPSSLATLPSSAPAADKGYELTLRQPKAPRTTAPLPSEDDPATAPLEVPRDISIPPSPPVSAPAASPSPPPAPVFPPLPPTPSFPPPPAAASPSSFQAMPSLPKPPTTAPVMAAAPAQPPRAPAPPPAAPPQRATSSSTVPRPAPSEPTERLERAPGRSKTGPVPSPTPRGTVAPPPKRKSGQFESAPQPVSREVSRENPALSPAQRVSAEAIADAVADVFDATQDLLMEGVVEPRRVAEALLDIALAHVPAESGSFYLADLNGHVLSFAAVRGPRADAIMRGRFTVPVGQGIIGFCALEGICLRVADMQKDPHYSAEIANAIGYAVKDTLCASAEKDGRLYGAVQLINSRGGFSAVHMEVLRYIGLTAAQLLERHFESV